MSIAALVTAASKHLQTIQQPQLCLEDLLSLTNTCERLHSTVMQQIPRQQSMGWAACQYATINALRYGSSHCLPLCLTFS